MYSRNTTLFNSGTVNGQLASCFLMGINSDSISAIYDALKDTALISKNSGELVFIFTIFVQEVLKLLVVPVFQMELYHVARI